MPGRCYTGSVMAALTLCDTADAGASVLACGAGKEWRMEIQCGAIASAALHAVGPRSRDGNPKRRYTLATRWRRTRHAAAAPHSKTQADSYVDSASTARGFQEMLEETIQQF